MAAFSYRDRVVLLTGAARGIGRALAVRLAAHGARLILTSRLSSDLEAVAAQLSPTDDVTLLDADLSEPDAARSLAESARAVHGHVDVLVNNAGVGYFALMEESTEERIRELFEVNTFAPLALVRALLPTMKARGEGRIVNIVSALGRVPVPTTGVYGASKTALAVAGNVLRLELEPAGIEVVNIYPGTVDTDFERHAQREAGRMGLHPGGGAGVDVVEAAERILEAAAGPGGEVWFEPEGRRMAANAILAPRVLDRRLVPLRDRLLHEATGAKPAEDRIWRRWRVEASRPCALRCERCPNGVRELSPEGEGLMREETWAKLRPLLGEVGEVGFCGGGDPLVHARLPDWIGEAREAGARAGLRTSGASLDDVAVARLLDVRADWVELTLGGVDADAYRATRSGLAFETFAANVRRLTSRRRGDVPQVSFRYVIVRGAPPRLDDVIRLADELDVDEVSFTHCDIVHEMDTGRPALFGRAADPEVRALEKELRRARRLAKKLGIETRATSFVPEEQPVCAFDPRSDVFVRHDGIVAPCLNLGVGGKTCFLGTSVSMPTERYGDLDADDLLDIWRSKSSRRYRDAFRARVKANDEVAGLVTFRRSLRRLEETLDAAREAMPAAPEPCRSCRYLFNL